MSSPLSTADSNASATGTTRLRVLATTDIHMQLLGHDYVTDMPTTHHGLAGIATLIKNARAEAVASHAGCILLDNGDMIQGTIVGDMLAAQPVTPAHPLVSCINALHYDAIGLGNHDLDFGLPYLSDISRKLDMPMVSSNLKLRHSDFIQNTALIECKIPRADGTQSTLQVGILSILPAKTAIWNRHVLEGRADTAPSLPCLRAAIGDLKAKDAQVIILLAHMGIGDAGTDQDENALSFAQIPGIDAIIAGHTHRRFPGTDHTGISDVDIFSGTIAQRPAIMPGNAGSDLAVLDLALSHGQTGWRVTQHSSALRSNTADLKPDPQIAALCMPAHIAARTHLSEPVGQTATALHNYFSLVMPTPIAALTARAKARVVRAELAGTADANTPLLASVAAHTAGGRGGPDHFLNIAQGPVLRRHIAGLSPYANQIWAVRVSGADLRAMLENTATIFHTTTPSQCAKPLITPLIPSFNFDTVFGVRYLIDPSKPPGARISHLTYQGHPVAPNDPFILTTNQFRAAGGGGVPPSPSANVALRSEANVSDALIDALAHPDDAVWPSDLPWSFDCGATVQVTMRTSPNALNYLADAADLHPVYQRHTPDGFVELRLTL